MILSRISWPKTIPHRFLPRSIQSCAKSRKTPLAFAFDIDGVLLRGEHALPQAKRALALLERQRLKIPYVLLTNGGGVSEEARCQKLTKQLGFDIQPSQYIQAHTILKSEVAKKYAQKPVLVLGGRGDQVRKVAEGYGFEQVYTTLDVHAWNPAVWPFHALTTEEKASVKVTDFSNTQISAVIVFHDPRNWSLDIQIILDVIQSNGIIGGPYKPAETPVELIFCNPDLLWRSDFLRPRLGQGAFKEAFQSVYKSVTGINYPYVQYGKPTTATYEFAEKILSAQLNAPDTEPLSNIYMVGDNPESDIAGGNKAGWKTILVNTGVFDPSKGPPSHTPTYMVTDVEQAVKLAMGENGYDVESVKP